MKHIKASLAVLSEDEIALLHKSALSILAETGIHTPHPEVCALVKAMGAQVDEANQVVRIPPAVMEEFIARIPLEADPAFQKTDDILRPISGNVSTQIFYVDYATNSRRYGTMADVMTGISLIGGLEHIPMANAVVVPSDVPSHLSDVLSFEKIYKYSKKPGGTYILTPQSAEHIVAMSRVVGREVSYLFDTISPLSFSKNTLDIALVFRKHRLCMTMTPMVMAGSTGPVTLSGTLALQNAEALASLFFIYAITGKMAAYVASAHTSDIERNMLCSFGSPNQGILGIATAQMAAHYGLVSGSNSGLTDSIFPDFQCGFEKGSTAAFSILAGNRAVGGQGLVGNDQGFSMAQLVLDNEWLSAMNHMLGGFTVNEETIGLETIAEVSRGGNFLSEYHTVQFMRDSNFHSKVFDRDSWDMLQSRGHNLLLRAEERAKALIAENPVDTCLLAPSVAAEIDYIVADAMKGSKI